VWAEDDDTYSRGGDRQVAFWLEYDTGTEPLARLVGKLDPYARLHAAGGPDYPVLFQLPGPAREAHLHDLLAHHPQRPGVIVATTTPTAVATRPVGVTGPVWLLDGATTRSRLIDLPNDPGRPGPYHPGPPVADQDPLFLLRRSQLDDEGQLDDDGQFDAADRLVDGQPN
jgi:hypothetical protein